MRWWSRGPPRWCADAEEQHDKIRLEMTMPRYEVRASWCEELVALHVIAPSEEEAVRFFE